MSESNNSSHPKAPRFSSTKIGAVLRITLIFVVYVLAFIVLDLSAHAVQVFPGIVAWYPPDGLSFAFLLIFGVGFLPAVAIASIISSFFVFQLSLSFSTLFGWAIFISLIYGFTAWFLRQKVRLDTQLHSMRDVLWLIASAVIVSTILAVISVSAATASGVFPQAERVWATVQWWIGEMIGLLILTPALLIHIMPHVKRFAEGDARVQKTPISFRRPSPWVIMQALSIIATIYLAVDVSWPNDFHPFFLIAIPLIWISVQHGISGASIGNILVNFGITGALQGQEHFNLAELGQLQLMMLVITLASLLIGIIVSEDRQAAGSAMTEMTRRRKKIVYELILISILAMAAWVLEHTFDFYEAITEWETRYQIKGVHETLVTIFVLGIASAIFSYRRWKEVQVEIREREKAQAELRALYRELEARIQERAADLLETNKLLQTEIFEREQIEQTLRVSEDRYHDLVDNSRDLICTHDLEGRILSVNPHAEHALGYSTGDLLNKDLRDFLTPDMQKFFNRYLSTIRKRGIAEGTMLVRTIKGETRVWEYRNTLRTEGVTVPIVRGMARDITEQKQAERALRESEQRFRLLFTTSPDAIVLIDPHNSNVSWPIVDCNDSACQMNGYTREDLIGHSVDILNITEGTDEERLIYLERLRHEGVIHIETIHRHKKGHTFPVEVSTSLFAFEGRELVLAIDRDITERKRAEEALLKSERRFRALVEQSLEEISLVDPDGTLIFESPTTRRPLGYPPGSFAGHNLFELFHPDDRAGAIKLLEQVIRQPGSHQEALFRLRHLDGSWRWMEGVVTNLLDEPAVQAVVVNYRDITERKRAEEELFQSKERYRSLFEDSPVSLWEEDFSAVKQRLDALRERGVTDLRAYLISHPEVVAECAALVKVVDVNKATLELSRTKSKQHLLKNLAEVLPEETLDNFRDELARLAEGQTKFDWEGINRTLTGERKDVHISVSVARIHEQDLSTVIVSVVDITERKQAEEEIRSRTDELGTLYQLSRDLAEANELDQVLDLVNRRTVESVHTTFARIALLEGDEFVTRSAYPIRVLDHELFVGSRKPISAMPYCQRVLEQDKLVILHRGNAEVSGEESAALLLDFAKTLCLVPLRVHDFALHSSRTLGLLIVGEARQEDREPFTPEKMRLTRSIGDQAAIAIDNTRLFNDLQQSNIDLSLAYDATIAGWSAALDLRDKETEGHTQRVTEMTLRLAARVRFSGQELVHVRRGALLHDIGKMGVPDRILLKPDKLTDEEWILMRMHPTYAHQMLAPITYLGPALEIPYCHHEKWDGTGYPRRLKGEQIPFAARIFAIVDVYDALTSDRPYRNGWSREKTLEHIRELSGSHFDPRVVDAFLELMEAGT